MKQCEFSETQFVIGYTRELFNSSINPFLIYAPSTREEKKWASDLIIQHSNGRYKYSEFYQFKRSKYFNKEVFGDLMGKTIIDTSISPYFGFNIYNSKKTKQFDVLQKLARTSSRNKVYYCAPNFYTLIEFNHHFTNKTILNNSKVIDLAQPKIQRLKIPLDSNHKIIFDATTTHVCSDPMEIKGSKASDRNKNNNYEGEMINETYDLEQEIKKLYDWVIEQIYESKLAENFEKPEINFFEVKELLLRFFNIYWIPFLETKQ